MNRDTGATTTYTAGGTSAFHMMMSPGGVIFSAGIPGELASYPGTLTANGTPHAVTGDDTAIDTISWDADGNAYYTASGAGGFGAFGRIDMTTFTTTRLLSGVEAAHGMTFDPYTGTLILFGDSHVSQIDPADPTVILSDLDLSGFGFNFDQGTTDGKGHVFAADNGGRLLFLDITTSGLVGAPDFGVAPFLAANLDDIAPLSGPGSLVPEPGSLTLLGLGAAGLVGARLRRRAG
ncbi:MAG: PEP-CTERM sorting domain-containing protein [Gemmataceae bacterium]|nr:PEP-CTERM sorting domain-containing protein [Gemmataceae bacterium]